MDSRIVNREIRREIWPALRRLGFDSFTGRTAWQHAQDLIKAINFQSFNSYFASVDGCTTYSFAVNLGIYFRSLTEDTEDTEAPAHVRPRVNQCHFQSKLTKGLIQQNYIRLDIWYVDRQGSNLLDVLTDARQTLLTKGMEWFDYHSQPARLLETLSCRDEDESLFGIGARWSPARKLLIGRAAIAAGEEKLGLRILNEAEAEIRSTRLQFESIGRNGRSPKPS